MQQTLTLREVEQVWSMDCGQKYDVMGEENRSVKNDAHISGLGIWMDRVVVY